MSRKIIIFIMVGLLVVSLLVVKNIKDNITDNIVNEEVKNLHEVSLSIENMYCVSCAYGVEAQFKELDGVISAKVDYQTAKGLVRYDADKVNPETIATASTVYPASIVEDKKA